ncbi:MAG: VOC family protein [Verrucomicrobia bacterium]|nr:VOC family protein [Verrucomicrobiota bacterium]MDA1066572.1 VOC family protein [Verrucomicrobiota bacterium]
MTKKIDSFTVPGASFDNLKKQAKSLLKQVKENNPHGVNRLSRANVSLLGKHGEPGACKLADAQRVIAHENGCNSWTELKNQVERNAISKPMYEENIQVLGIDQIWLDCANLEETERFYGDILGLKKVGEVPGQMLFFDCGGVNLLLGLKKEISPNSILYLNIGDTEAAIQSAYNRLKLENASVGDSPHCIAKNWNGFDVWMAFFKDPSGNQLAFKCNIPVQ